MISNLPRDLLEDMFSRVPLKSMKAVRLTCKSLNALSKSPSFTKMHIGKSATATRSMMIAMMNYNSYLLSVAVHDVNPYYTEPKLKGKLSCLNKQVNISQVSHCEGLLLCILEENGNSTRFLVWNPYWGQTRWIEPRYSRCPNGRDMFCYALGYEDHKDKSCRSYKLLRFIDYHFLAPEDHFFWNEIYDFDSDLWTSLDVTPHWCILSDQRGVSLKGNTYWCARERNLDDEEVFVDRIICFDFTREKFGPLLPLPFSVGYNDYVILSCVGEEKLAVLFQHRERYSYELDIWITTKIEAEEVSWSKFLRVETTLDIRVPYIRGGVFIDEEKKVAMGFDEDYHKTFNIIKEAGYFSQLDRLEEFGDQNCQPYVCSYVPSLVQIKQPTEGERKQQSNLEKRRYDQNMLRLVALEKRIYEEYAGWGKRRKRDD